MTDESRPALKLAAETAHQRKNSHADEQRSVGRTGDPCQAQDAARRQSTTIGATASRAGPSGSACTASTVNRTTAAQAADAAGSVGCTVSPSLTPAAAEAAANR
jgi:hypothetical protein